jgi:hypothetical protein
LCIYSLILPFYHLFICFLTAAERRGIIPPEIKKQQKQVAEQVHHEQKKERVLPPFPENFFYGAVKFL